MLNMVFKSPFQLVLAQTAGAALAALLVALLARKRGIHVETETAVALLRGALQIVAVGSILVSLLRGPRWTGAFLLAAMILAAGATSRKRAKGLSGAFEVSTYAIACGAGSVIAIMTWLGVIDTAITTLIPVGSADRECDEHERPGAEPVPFRRARARGRDRNGAGAGRRSQLSGSRPIYSAIYQFVVLAMIFAASGLTSVSDGLFGGY